MDPWGKVAMQDPNDQPSNFVLNGLSPNYFQTTYLPYFVQGKRVG